MSRSFAGRYLGDATMFLIGAAWLQLIARDTLDRHDLFDNLVGRMLTSCGNSPDETARG